MLVDIATRFPDAFLTFSHHASDLFESTARQVAQAVEHITVDKPQQQRGDIVHEWWVCNAKTGYKGVLCNPFKKTAECLSRCGFNANASSQTRQGPATIIGMCGPKPYIFNVTLFVKWGQENRTLCEKNDDNRPKNNNLRTMLPRSRGVACCGYLFGSGKTNFLLGSIATLRRSVSRYVF